MSHPALHPAVSRSAPGQGGFGQLAPHQALSLFAAAGRELRVAQGRVWVTTGHRHGIEGWPPSGDMVLCKGDVLHVPAGAHLVMESWPDASGEPVLFQFADQALAGVGSAAHASRFQREVAQPARELGAALRQAVRATGRLLAGLAGCARVLVAGRGRVLSPLEGGMPP